jgi:hypothetical protein
MRYYYGKFSKEDEDPEELLHSECEKNYHEQESLNRYENQREDA